MKQSSPSKRLMIALSLIVLSSCGGSIDTELQQQASKTAVEGSLATLMLSTSVTGTISPMTTINSYVITLQLPDGASVKSTEQPPETDAGVVTASGAARGATAIGTYTAATQSAPATIRIFIAKVDPVTGAGFEPGEFCTVKVDVAAGHVPAETSFTPSLTEATGFNSATLTSVLHLEEELSLKTVVLIE